ncbi:hypothetical protein RB195_011120 [Necator americanus]|uniref:Uncharacterized protein n=1 Tax=Necator americanus TaxID=51031 RepID=A0ABR1D126_NECAM
MSSGLLVLAHFFPTTNTQHHSLPTTSNRITVGYNCSVGFGGVLDYSTFLQCMGSFRLKGQLPERSMESLATTIRFVTLNCRTLSSELQQAALSGFLRYLCVPFAALQETSASKIAPYIAAMLMRTK